MTAQLVDYFAQRYGQLPSAVLQEDAMTLLRMRAIIAEAEGDDE